MTASLKRALKTHFGFENFRSKLQEDVVKAVVKGEFGGPGSAGAALPATLGVSRLCCCQNLRATLDNGGAAAVLVLQATGMCSCACRRGPGSPSATSCLRSRRRASLWSSRLSSPSFRSVAEYTDHGVKKFGVGLCHPASTTNWPRLRCISVLFVCCLFYSSLFVCLISCFCSAFPMH